MSKTLSTPESCREMDIVELFFFLFGFHNTYAKLANGLRIAMHKGNENTKEKEEIKTTNTNQKQKTTNTP